MPDVATAYGHAYNGDGLARPQFLDQQLKAAAGKGNADPVALCQGAVALQGSL